MSSTPVPSDRPRQIIVLVVIIIGTIVANLLGATISATDTGDIANATFGDSVFFFPASYVFATIWPVIYLGIVGLAIHQSFPSQAANPRYRRGMWTLAINLLLNAGWVAVFGARLFALSLATIIPILISAVLAYAWLGIGGRFGGDGESRTQGERIFTIPVSIYVAWLTIATVANVSLVLADAGWAAFGISYATWGVIMIAVGVVLGAILVVLFRDPVIAAVYAYAYAGILVRRLGETQSVATSAVIGAAIFVVGFAAALFVFRRKA